MRMVWGMVLSAQLFAAPAFAQEAGVSPPQTLPTPPPAQTLPHPYRLPAADDVTVHIESNFEAAGLEPAELGAARCLAPCDKPFPRDGVYRITGDGLIPMTAHRTAGAVIGIGGIIVGSLGALYSTLLAVEAVDGPPVRGTQKDISIGASVGGVAAMAVGALLYFTAGTRVRAKGAPLRLAF